MNIVAQTIFEYFKEQDPTAPDHKIYNMMFQLDTKIWQQKGESLTGTKWQKTEEGFKPVE